jgi:hypothetical protein
MVIKVTRKGVPPLHDPIWSEGVTSWTPGPKPPKPKPEPPPPQPDAKKPVK